jgi:myo-inositol catabolism protein IolC
MCCLPGHENVWPEQGILKKLTRKFYHKSGTELRLEQEQQIKLLPTLKNF